jgi:small redox-active disulfide protein 2
MIRVQVFGTHCAACVTLEKNVRAAVADLGAGFEVEKVSQLLDMVQHGITQIPALAIDGQVRSMGRALDVQEVKALLVGAMAGTR